MLKDLCNAIYRARPFVGSCTNTALVEHKMHQQCRNASTQTVWMLKDGRPTGLRPQISAACKNHCFVSKWRLFPQDMLATNGIKRTGFARFSCQPSFDHLQLRSWHHPLCHLVHERWWIWIFQAANTLVEILRATLDRLMETTRVHSARVLHGESTCARWPGLLRC